MKFFKKDNLKKGLEYSFIKYNNEIYFFEKIPLIENGKLMGFKKPKLNDFLKFLEEEYETEFVLTEENFLNVFGLSTKKITNNIRLTEFENFPDLDSNGLKCEFRYTPYYKLYYGNSLSNLVSNSIEFLLKGKAGFYVDKNHKVFDKIREKLKESEIIEVNYELEARMLEGFL